VKFHAIGDFSPCQLEKQEGLQQAEASFRDKGLVSNRTWDNNAIGTT